MIERTLKPLFFKIISPYFTLLCLTAILALSGCSNAPEVKPIAVENRKPLIDYALSLQGTPYRWGKSSPEEGFDCSGFVQHVYKQYGVNLPRTVHQMAITLPEVSKNDLSEGDLLLFNTKGNSASHVGLYICDDKFVHAPSKRAGKVQVASLNNSYWRKRFIGVRRPSRHHNK